MTQQNSRHDDSAMMTRHILYDVNRGYQLQNGYRRTPLTSQNIYFIIMENDSVSVCERIEELCTFLDQNTQDIEIYPCYLCSSQHIRKYDSGDQVNHQGDLTIFKRI